MRRFWFVTAAVLGILAARAPKVQADPVTPGNILVTHGDSIYEYQLDSTQVQQLTAPVQPGCSEALLEDVCVDNNGIVHVVNGGYPLEPRYVSSYDPATDSWQHNRRPGWTRSGCSLDAYGGYLYAENLPGIRYDLADFSYMDIPGGVATTVGLDGKYYTLDASYDIHVYDRSTFDELAFIESGTDLRAIAANEAGEVFAASWSGYIYHYSPSGETLNTFNLRPNLQDIDLAPDGTLIVSAAFGNEVFILDESLSNEHLSSIFLTDAASPAAFVGFAAPVPEPSTCLLLSVAGCGLLGYTRRRRKR